MSASGSTRPAVDIRPARSADAALIAEQRAAMFRDMGELPPRLESEFVRASQAYLAPALERGDYLGWIAEDTAGNAVGGAGAHLRPILPRPSTPEPRVELGPEAVILNVYVAPAQRRNGIGRALMERVLDDLAKRGVTRIVLHASDDGRKLYERLGFVPTTEMRLSAPAESGAEQK